MGSKSKIKRSQEHKQKMMDKERNRDAMQKWVAENPRKPGQTIYVTPKVMNPKLESDATIVATPVEVPVHLVEKQDRQSAIIDGATGSWTEVHYSQIAMGL